jgi:hypothetical protein
MATSLYERLGGVYAIAAVIDDFIDRVMDNPRLNANPMSRPVVEFSTMADGGGAPALDRAEYARSPPSVAPRDRLRRPVRRPPVVPWMASTGPAHASASDGRARFRPRMGPPAARATARSSHPADGIPLLRAEKHVTHRSRIRSLPSTPFFRKQDDLLPHRP